MTKPGLCHLIRLSEPGSTESKEGLLCSCALSPSAGLPNIPGTVALCQSVPPELLDGNLRLRRSQQQSVPRRYRFHSVYAAALELRGRERPREIRRDQEKPGETRRDPRDPLVRFHKVPQRLGGLGWSCHAFCSSDTPDVTA